MALDRAGDHSRIGGCVLWRDLLVDDMTNEQEEWSEQDREFAAWNKAILIAALAVWVIIWAVAYWSTK